MPPSARVLPGCTSAAASASEIILWVMRDVRSFLFLCLELLDQPVELGRVGVLLFACLAPAADSQRPLGGFPLEALVAAQQSKQAQVEAQHQCPQAAEDDQPAWVRKQLVHGASITPARPPAASRRSSRVSCRP